MAGILPINTPQMDFSWISQLGPTYRAAQDREFIKETLAGLDIDDVESLTKTARALQKHPAGFAMGLKLDEMARAREKLDRERKEDEFFMEGVRRDPYATEQTGAQQTGIVGPQPLPREVEPQVRPQTGPTPMVGSTPSMVRPIMPSAKHWGTEEGKRAGLYPADGEETQVAENASVRPTQVAENAPVIRPTVPRPIAPLVTEPVRSGLQPRSAEEQQLKNEHDYYTKMLPVARTKGKEEFVKQKIKDVERRMQDFSGQRAEERKADIGERVAIGAENRAQLAKAGEETRVKEKTADTTLNTIKVMEKAAEDPRLISGPIAPYFASVGRALGSLSNIAKNYGFGMPDFDTIRDDTSKIEQFNSLHKTLVRSTFTSLGNGVNAKDVTLMETIFPSVENDIHGIRKMLLFQRKTNERVKDAAAEERRYRRTPGATRDGLDDHMAEWSEKHPLFTEREIEYLGGGDPSKVPGPGGRVAPPAGAAVPGAVGAPIVRPAGAAPGVAVGAAPSPGKIRIPNAASIEALQSDPSRAAEFDLLYGRGEAGRYLQRAGGT